MTRLKRMPTLLLLAALTGCEASIFRAEPAPPRLNEFKVEGMVGKTFLALPTRTVAGSTVFPSSLATLDPRSKGVAVTCQRVGTGQIHAYGPGGNPYYVVDLTCKSRLSTDHDQGGGEVT